jgi:hypothetical protein
VKLMTHLHVAPKSRIRGAITLLPPVGLYGVVSVKSTGFRINADGIKHMFTSCHQNAGKIIILKSLMKTKKMWRSSNIWKGSKEKNDIH